MPPFLRLFVFLGTVRLPFQYRVNLSRRGAESKTCFCASLDSPVIGESSNRKEYHLSVSWKSCRNRISDIHVLLKFNIYIYIDFTIFLTYLLRSCFNNNINLAVYIIFVFIIKNAKTGFFFIFFFGQKQPSGSKAIK